MMEILSALDVLAPILLAPIVTFFVQKAKKRANPLVALAVLSLLVGVIHGTVIQVVPAQILEEIIVFSVGVAGIANLIYNVLKAFVPTFVGKEKK